MYGVGGEREEQKGIVGWNRNLAAALILARIVPEF